MKQFADDEERRAYGREVMRKRRRDPQKRAKDYAVNRVNIRALWRLSDLHREDFERLVAEERALEGLPLIPWDRQTADEARP